MIFDLVPAKTYKTRENAVAAVRKWADKFNFDGRAFNLMVVDYTVPVHGLRYVPILVNIDKNFLQNAIHSGFNCIN